MEAEHAISAPSAGEIAQLGQALMLGTRKRPITLPPRAAALAGGCTAAAPALVALVLAGQHSRFERPPALALAPPQDGDRALHADPRPMLSDISRRLLGQLLATMKGHAPHAAFVACHDRIAARDLRLHPFDLPELAPYLRDTGLRPSARAMPDHAKLDPDSWKTMPPDQRADALRRLRQSSPDAARALLEAAFRSETAAHRATFLGALAVNLGAADVPFLEGAARDRAEAVRNAASGLLGRIPGTAAYEQRLDRAAGLAKLERGRLLRAPKLSLDAAKTGPLNQPARASLFNAFDGLSIADLAARFQLSEKAFVEAVPAGEDGLILALLSTACAGGDAGLAVSLASRLSGPKALMALAALKPEGLDMPGDCRGALTEAFVESAIGGAYPDGLTIHALYRLADQPLPERLAAQLLASKSWRNHIAKLFASEADRQTPNSITATAFLVPDSQLDAFLASIADVPPHLTLSARLFADFCKSLAQTAPVAPLTQSL